MVLFRCEEGEHNDLATLFLSSSHHTIIKLFSMGHDPGEPYVTHFTQGSLALFVVIYLILMSVGAGVAIPGGLFMPSLIVSQASPCQHLHDAATTCRFNNTACQSCLRRGLVAHDVVRVQAVSEC